MMDGQGYYDIRAELVAPIMVLVYIILIAIALAIGLRVASWILYL